jgi:hypothetical protein
VSLLILAIGAHLLLGPEERLAFSFYDDAYYYLGVASTSGRGTAAPSTASTARTGTTRSGVA